MRRAASWIRRTQDFVGLRTALSMTAVMAATSLLALVLYLLVARPAERRLPSQTIDPGVAVRSPTKS